MFSNRFQMFVSGVMLTLAVLRPNMPVWAGVALLMIVMTGAQTDLSSKSSRNRWMAFKRMTALFIMGCILIFAGVGIESAPWQLSVTNAEQARHAMAVLAVYGIAIIGAPVLAWMHLSQRGRRPKRIVAQTNALYKLPNLACAESIRRVRIA